jgi:hypothetical protein
MYDIELSTGCRDRFFFHKNYFIKICSSFEDLSEYNI